MIDRSVAKELLHIKGWLESAKRIVSRGEKAYLEDTLLQEAGDSLMMKIGEAANRLSHLDVKAPPGVDWSIVIANRNFLIHRYDAADRRQTWQTLALNLPELGESLTELFADANRVLNNSSELDQI
ncbi:MAG: DUF86 domain-containing protein [Cryobacterium sp.]|nr:DUF86 domain-containing protein [Cryobacterium sp.]MBX3104985.1 DUF86 domain-containing protein [Cryobacterium sp.]